MRVLEKELKNLKQPYPPDLSRFHEDQQKAIRHKDGPALVLAGPGSGKTTVITQRANYLIEAHHIPPSQILVITFTRAAAEEMQKRFMALASKPYPVRFGTFHSLFFHILRQTYHYTFQDIVREYEKAAYLREILNEPGYGREQTAQMVQSLLSEISIVKNSGADPAHYQSCVLDGAAFARLYDAYGKCLKWHGKLDFDDMLLQCFQLFTKRADILEKWQKEFSYILIDEFQDSSQMQYEAVRMLAMPENNLFAVGDDDQSIYAFRGAKPAVMRLFTQDYKNTVCIPLSQNYRSAGEIVSRAGALIVHNKERFAKQIHAAGPYKDAGGVIYQAFPDKEAEYAAMVKQLREQHLGTGLSDTAVIYRTNQESAYLAECLAKAGIPFFAKEKTSSIYQSASAKDLFAYMQFAATPRRGLFYQIMNKPLRYISRSAVNDEMVSFESLLAYYERKPRMREAVWLLRQQMEYLATLPPYAAIVYIRRGIGYDDYIETQTGQAVRERMREEVEELTKRAKQYASLEEWKKDIRTYEEALQKQGSRGAFSQKEGGVLQIMTMHGAKGLEYRTVYIPDMNEGNIPHNKSMTQEEIEEERRMLYVAMTRAKETLYLYYVDGGEARKRKSRFLEEIVS